MLLDDQRRWQWLAAKRTAAFFNSRAPRMILLSQFDLVEHIGNLAAMVTASRDIPRTTLTQP